MGKIKAKIDSLYQAGALHVTLGTFITKFVAFFGSIVVVRILSKKDYGVMSYVENIYSYALLAAGLGLSYAILRYVVLGDDINEKKGIYDYVIKSSVLIDILIVVGVVIANQFITYSDGFSSAKLWVPILMILLPFQDLVSETQFTLRAFFKNKLYAYYALFVSTTLILGRIVGAYFDGVGGVFISRIVINAFWAALGLVLIYKLFFKGVHSKPLERTKKKEINIYSFQYMITNGLWALIMLNDTFMLGQLTSNPEVLADYKVAYVLPGNISIFATAIGVFVSPYFTRHEKDHEWVRKKYKEVFIITAIVVGTVALIFSIFAPFIINLMYGKQYLNTVGLMRALMLAAFFNSGLRFTSANLLAAMGKIKYNLIVSLAGIIIQIILDYLLIPIYGANGVAISNCVVFSMMAIVLFIVFYKQYYKEKTL